MMTRKSVATLAAALLASASAQAFTIDFQAFFALNPDARFLNSAGEHENGIPVRLGTFGSDPAANAGNYDALNADFSAFTISGDPPPSATSMIGAGAGSFNASTTNITGASGQQVYIFAGNDQEWGVFTGANFVGLGDDQLLNLSINATQVDEAVWGNIVQIPGGGFGGKDTNHLQLAPIPEPSTYALIALGLGGLAIFLRRRNG